MKQGNRETLPSLLIAWRLHITLGTMLRFGRKRSYSNKVKGIRSKALDFILVNIKHPTINNMTSQGNDPRFADWAREAGQTEIEKFFLVNKHSPK